AGIPIPRRIRRSASFGAVGFVADWPNYSSADTDFSRLSSYEVFLDRLPKPVRLALEMAAHEDIERRAMEGELAMLELAWRQAEEIAVMSDFMFTEDGDKKL